MVKSCDDVERLKSVGFIQIRERLVLNTHFFKFPECYVSFFTSQLDCGP